MSEDPFRCIVRRLEAGEVAVEALVLEGPKEAPVGTRWVLDGAGERLSGPYWPRGLEAIRGEVAGLDPARRSAVVSLEPEGARLRVYLERWAAPPRVVLLGGGHVGKALCSVLRDLEFTVVMVEDREYFADPRRFEGLVRVVLSPFGEAGSAAGIGPEDYVVIATRGHREDLTCLRDCLPRRPFYLGLLGSRRKWREFHRVLCEEGVPQEELLRVRTPVGLDIGAETPEEIALSVAAELVAARAGRLAPGRRCREAASTGLRSGRRPRRRPLQQEGLHSEEDGFPGLAATIRSNP